VTDTTTAPAPTSKASTPPTETADSRLSDLEFEFACMRRALLSLGSALMSGGPPGALPYIAWHKDQMVNNPVPRPVAAAPGWTKLREDGPTLKEFLAEGFSAADYPPPGYAAKLDPPAAGTPTVNATPVDGFSTGAPPPSVTPVVAPTPTEAELKAATPLPQNVAPPVSGSPMPASLPANAVGQPAPPSPAPLPPAAKPA
jgi:hypothetical protein